ncbi:MAG: LacI family DNA-binding transcriptional regulator [Roseiflexaceae bacterium]
MTRERKPATITDIAKAANVSPSTVSRVLTGSAPVAAEKRAAVEAAIQALHFRPNLHARNLVRGESTTIGVVVSSATSPYYADVLGGLLEALDGSHYHIMLAASHWYYQRNTYIQKIELVARQSAGLVVIGGTEHEAALLAINTYTPIVCVGRKLHGLEHVCFLTTNQQGAYEATKHLIELGHRRIALLSGMPWHPEMIERRTGYEQALREAGLPIDESLIAEGNFSEQSGQICMEWLMQQRIIPDAVFAANDQMAYGAHLALYRAELRVPNDVSLVGFDNLANSAYHIPPLTTVSQHLRERGYAAGRALLQILNDEHPQAEVIPTSLIIRQSTTQRS